MSSITMSIRELDRLKTIQRFVGQMLRVGMETVLLEQCGLRFRLRPA